MGRVSLAITLILAVLFSSPCASAKPKAKRTPSSTYPFIGNPYSKYRGWDYLVSRLKAQGMRESDLAAIYQNPHMPRFTFVPFKLKPAESKEMYSIFHRDSFAELGASFIQEHDQEFDRLERTYKVPREIVTAILVVETQIGRYTGKEQIVFRLSRIASVLDPNNVQENYKRLKRDQPTVTLDEVVTRGQYLQSTFLPEIPALIEISKRNKVNPFHIQGSTAGAFGIPQFLPSAFIKFGIDGDRDGYVSLFNKVDAIWSTANYLAAFGYDPSLPHSVQRKVIWEYNRSDAYIDTIFRVSTRIRELQATSGRYQPSDQKK